MKNLFAITLIATLAVASAMAAQEVPQDFNAVANTDEEDIAAVIAASIPASAEEEQALWKKKKKHHHHKHGKHGKHGKHKYKKCCIKYVTITSVPACKPSPSKRPPKVAEMMFDPLKVNGDIAPPAPLPLQNNN
ncbi:hypothetical protein BGZ82_001020 [Podila clonocystis]|nr:hypothetical protein BGZ82_001020 [Podila clonocystis]